MKYVIPILSLIISVIALAVAIPRCELGFDYLGVIVAIISLATAFAVGFQIWNALSLETRLKELKSQVEKEYIEKMNSLEDKFTSEINLKSDILSCISQYQTAIVSASICIVNQSYSGAFFFYIQALEFETILLNEYNTKLPCYVEPSIHAIIDKQTIKITDPEEQKYIIKTIIDSGKEELIEKIGIIKTKIFKSEHAQD